VDKAQSRHWVTSVVPFTFVFAEIARRLFDRVLER
jgi:hypothetical protein